VDEETLFFSLLIYFPLRAVDNLRAILQQISEKRKLINIEIMQSGPLSPSPVSLPHCESNASLDLERKEEHECWHEGLQKSKSEFYFKKDVFFLVVL
jgi:hypothetical protein